MSGRAIKIALKACAVCTVKSGGDRPWGKYQSVPCPQAGVVLQPFGDLCMQCKLRLDAFPLYASAQRVVLDAGDPGSGTAKLWNQAGKNVTPEMVKQCVAETTETQLPQTKKVSKNNFVGDNSQVNT